MIVIFDLECYKNFFSYTAVNRNTGEWYVYCVGHGRDDRQALYQHMNEVKGMIGFNNLHYDYPLLHYVLFNKTMQTANVATFNELAKMKSDGLIKNNEFFPQWEIKIPQLDLFKIHHLDNKAKSTGLKQVAFWLEFPIIDDLPYDPSLPLPREGVDRLLEYNKFDVDVTRKFYEVSRGEIEMRRALSQKFKLPLMNANSPKIGQEIFMKFIAQKKGVEVKELKALRTYRDSISFMEIMLPCIQFESQQLQDVLRRFSAYVWRPDGVEFSTECYFKEVVYAFGQGGLHAACKEGVYEASEEMVIMSSDVASFYPNLAIKNNFYPQHLGMDFCHIYDDIFKLRRTFDKKTPENLGLKLALNGVYGKSGDKHSPFFDMQYMFQITVNGQLLLMMLAEKAAKLGKVLMANTDGIEVMLPRNKVEEYMQICKEWESMTSLELEHNRYKKIVISNVNNYLAQDETGYIKRKGLYEYKKVYGEKEVHKDTGNLVVPKVLEAYFTQGLSIEQAMETCTPHDFCFRFKATEGWKPIHHFVEGSDLKQDILPKTIRYYVARRGGYIKKEHQDGRKEYLVKGYKTTPLPLMKESTKLEPDMRFYKREIMKIIQDVEKPQLKFI